MVLLFVLFLILLLLYLSCERQSEGGASATEVYRKPTISNCPDADWRTSDELWTAIH